MTRREHSRVIAENQRAQKVEEERLRRILRRKRQEYSAHYPGDLEKYLQYRDEGRDISRRISKKIERLYPNVPFLKADEKTAEEILADADLSKLRQILATVESLKFDKNYRDVRAAVYDCEFRERNKKTYKPKLGGYDPTYVGHNAGGKSGTSRTSSNADGE